MSRLEAQMINEFLVVFIVDNVLNKICRFYCVKRYVARNNFSPVKVARSSEKVRQA